MTIINVKIFTLEIVTLIYNVLGKNNQGAGLLNFYGKKRKIHKTCSI